MGHHCLAQLILLTTGPPLQSQGQESLNCKSFNGEFENKISGVSVSPSPLCLLPLSLVVELPSRTQSSADHRLSRKPMKEEPFS